MKFFRGSVNFAITNKSFYTLLYMDDKRYNPMQTVKRRFFAMRNGVIADTLRRAGSPFKVIFGLNLPQIVDIARDTGVSPVLAEQLWANDTTRESMLLAPMLADAGNFSIEDAKRWIASIPATEIADVLCLRLLRRRPYAWELAEELAGSSATPFGCYTGMRLAFNLVASDPERALRIAKVHADAPLARQLAEEAGFLLAEKN